MKAMNIAAFKDKNKCIDIFQNANVDGEYLYNKDSSIKSLIGYKFQLKSRMNMLRKLRVIISMKLVKYELYIKVLLKSINLQKELFVLEIE